jgi:hypothetical protein
MKNQKLGLAIFVAIFGGGVAVMLLFGRGLSVDATAVRRDLLTPYTVAIRGGDYASAWQRYTTASYRGRYPLEVLRTQYGQQLGAHGSLDDVNCPRVQAVREINAGDVIVARCFLRFHDGLVRTIAYTIAREGTNYRIADAMDATGSRGGGVAGAW